MESESKPGIKLATFDSFSRHGIPHGVFMRHGGVSPAPWKSLNLGGSNGDVRENVIENRKRIFDQINRPVDSLFDVWQVHSDVIICTEQPRPLDQEQVKADAILTSNKGITLFMRFADCVPIFLFDPVQQIIGMVHAGWQGTVQQIVRKTIEEMRRTYQSQSQNILAGIGPSICAECYEVKQDVISQVEQHLGDFGLQCILQVNGSMHLDLQKANYLQLKLAGVDQIELSGVCTACQADDWFSHRAENGRTGRLGALIAL
jgi:polyphenol oxidase